MRVRAIALCLLMGGCRGGGAADEEGAGTDTGGLPSEDACSRTSECEDEFCVAPYRPGEQPPRGPSGCVAECLGEQELAWFCIDDGSCCPGLLCSADGLCEPPFGSESEGGSETETETETGSETETETEGTSETDGDSTT